MMDRWALLLVRRRWWVIAGWIAILLLLGVAFIRWSGQLSDTFSLPNTESQRALDLLDDRFPAEAGSETRAVFHARSGAIADAPVQAALDRFIAAAGGARGVVRVSDPRQSPGDVSPDGRTAIVRVRYAERANELSAAQIEEVVEIGEVLRTGALQIEFGGEPIREIERESPGRAELIGIIAALIILLIGFGSVIAAVMPVVTALVGVAVGSMLIFLAANGISITTFAPAFGAMLGIGVGIDYTLFVIARFREQLAAGQSVEQAVRTAVGTAGRAVAFAGVIVAAALLGLLSIGIPVMSNLGISAAIVVFIEMLIAVSLLPAILAVMGRRVDWLSIPRLRYTVGGEHGMWYRFSRLIQRAPLFWLGLSSAILLALAIPTLDISLGISDDGSRPESRTSRRAFDLISDAYGPGVNAALIAVASSPGGALDEAFLARTRQELAGAAQAASVAPARVNAAGDAAVFTIIPKTPPQHEDTRALVHALRERHAPAALRGAAAGTELHITGATALTEDATDRQVARMPIFFAVVIGISLVLLMMAFRSILVPLKAAALNMLAIAASVGFVVAVFQWGWFLPLIGLDQTGPIETFIPMIMFAILFGLSMDYELFLLSRIRERFLQTGDSSESVAYGIGASARVITAAAAILIAVFGSFALFSDDRPIKAFGIGMSFAILIDATLVRLVLVPAFMELAGRANWWMPGWLDRVLPRLTIEAHGLHAPPSLARMLGRLKAPKPYESGTPGA